MCGCYNFNQNGVWLRDLAVLGNFGVDGYIWLCVRKRERRRGLEMMEMVLIELIVTIFWMLLQFILPGLNDTLCIVFYYLTMCLLGMWCFYYIGVVMAEMR